MSDTVMSPPPAADITKVTTTPVASPPWHQSVDNDMKVHWQSKGYDISDPVKVALAATKAHMEAVKFLGVPPNQLLRLPNDVNDEAGWNAVYQRFGAPADKSGYDFSKVKFGDGSDLDTGFADFMREKAHELHLPKNSAEALSQAFVGFMEQADKNEATQNVQRLAEQKAQLQKDWGNNYEFNRQTAVQGAQKLGATVEMVNALEQAAGYAAVMEMFRKVGSGTVEEAFIQGQQKGGEFMNAAQTAQHRLNELVANPQWSARLNSGEAEARREFDTLTKAIAGYVEEAA